MNYYWAGSYPLASGSVVEPGNWGRIFNIEQQGNFLSADRLIPPLKVIIETTFEGIRKESFPLMVSRLEGVFLFDNLDSAKVYLSVNKKYFDILYQVEVTNQNAKISRHPMDLVEEKKYPSGNPKDFDCLYQLVPTIMENAHKYWSNTFEAVIYEIITDSPIRIVSRI